MKTLSRLSMIMPLVAVLAACQGNNSVPQALSANVGAGIIGGETVPKNSWVAKQTVMLFSSIKGEDGYFLCTGTLVSRDIVLTAAHCVKSKKQDQTMETLVIFSTNYEQEMRDKTLNGKVIKVTDKRIHPEYGNRLMYGDLALLKLEYPAPSDYVVSELIQRTFYWPNLNEILIAGFGNTVGGGRRNNDPTILRSIKMQPLRDADRDSVHQQMMNADGFVRIPAEQRSIFLSNLLNPLFNPEHIWLNQTAGKGACTGDSGGPAFISMDGKTYQIGVTSFALKDKDERTCLMIAAYTNVLAQRTWLDQTFAELSGKPDATLFGKFGK